MRRLRCLFLFGILLLCAAVQPYEAADTGAGGFKYVGVRSSVYGIEPFPDEQEWLRALQDLAGRFPGAKPVAVWIVAPVNFATKGVDLEFPAPAGPSDPMYTFADVDKHQSYLDLFDRAGVDVFLQVEPGYADVEKLIDLVLMRYGDHPCVAGFGVDVEWYRNGVPHGGKNAKVGDGLARTWEARVKKHHPDYRLFLKHYAESNLPPCYRGDIVFIHDAQQYQDFDHFVSDMILFAETYYPNPVMYQIGYPKDKKWWSRFADPPLALGQALAARTRQECGLVWVDFTLREILRPDEGLNDK